MLLRSTHFTTPRAKKPIPETLRTVYADVVAKAVERHPQQIIKLLRSFSSEG